MHLNDIPHSPDCTFLFLLVSSDAIAIRKLYLRILVGFLDAIHFEFTAFSHPLIAISSQIAKRMSDYERIPLSRLIMDDRFNRETLNDYMIRLKE